MTAPYPPQPYGGDSWITLTGLVDRLKAVVDDDSLTADGKVEALRETFREHDESQPEDRP